MTRRSTFWLTVAVVFLLVNALGLGYAIRLRELHHAGVHAALLLLGAYVVGKVAARRIERADEERIGSY